MNKNQLQKAARWLNKKQTLYFPCVKIHSEGYAYFHAYIFKILRPKKTPLYFVMELTEADNEIKLIKRICTY